MSAERRNQAWATWVMTRACNLNCPYCVIEKKKAYEAAPVDKIIEALKSTGKDWRVTVTGGEPLAVPGFAEICAALTRHFTIDVKTNLTLGGPLRDFAQRIDPARVRVVDATFHLRELERTGLVGAFTDNLLMLKARGFRVSVKTVLHPELKKKYVQYRRFFKEKGFKLRPSHFIGTYENRVYPEAYTRQERRLLKKYRPAFDQHMPIDSAGLYCRAGRDYIFIDGNGVFKRCPKDRTRYGSVREGLRLDERSRPCAVRRCNCRGEWLIEKGLRNSVRRVLNKWTAKRHEPVPV